MDIEMFGKLSDAFGPSGFENEVIRTAASYLTEFRVENDAMFNLYARMPEEIPGAPIVQLDAHTDECGFMVQSINDNGTLGILILGGMRLNTLPAHSVIIRTRSGRKVRGIIAAKPGHFMTDKERASSELTIEGLCVDVGAISRAEVEADFGISIGDPIMPDVSFSYDAAHEVCFGKAFDNRAGCACIIDTMKQLYPQRSELKVNMVGAFASQEEVGERGATVTAQVVHPDLCILFEGSPSDDFFFSTTQAQGRMKQGVQIRRMDKGYIANTALIDFAEELAKKYGIRFQEAVRRGGSTNAKLISLTGKYVPTLVLGVPSRYVHSHYNFCAKADLEAASALAAEIIRHLDKDALDRIFYRNLL